MIESIQIRIGLAVVSRATVSLWSDGHFQGSVLIKAVEVTGSAPEVCTCNKWGGSKEVTLALPPTEFRGGVTIGVAHWICPCSY